MNTERQSEIMMAKEDRDWFLEFLVNIVDETGLTFGITLTVKGMTISGILISGKEFLEKGCKDWIMGWEPEIAKAFEKTFNKTAEKYMVNRSKMQRDKSL